MLKEEQHGIVSKGTQSSQYIGSVYSFREGRASSLYNNLARCTRKTRESKLMLRQSTNMFGLVFWLVALHQAGVEKAEYARCHPC
jgi:hypothetical protein